MARLKTYQNDIRVRVTVKPFEMHGEEDLFEVVNVLVMDEIPDQYDLLTKEELRSLGIEVGNDESL